MSIFARRWAAAAVTAACATALAGCSGDAGDGPVVIESGSSAPSVPGTFMTPPTTSTSVVTAASPSPSTTATSPDPADAAKTEDPGNAEGPEGPGSSGSSDVSETSEEPGPGTVVYRGTTYVMPPEETTPLAESLVVTFDVAPGIDVTGIDIEGAEKAYRGFVEVGDRAAQNPDGDWRAQFRRFAVDPVLSDVLAEIEGMAESDVISVGHSAFRSTVLHANTSEIELRICVDISGANTLDVNSGKPVKADTGDRHPQEATLERAANGRWHVSSIIGRPLESC